MEKVLLLSMVTASVSFTVAETKFFAGFRRWMKNSSSLCGELFSCGYCFGHWVALILAAMYKPRLFHAWWPLDYFFTVLVIAWLAAFQWALLAWLMEKAGK